ncbi:hypothetical protein SLEP1_g56788 [Rubroshorea leprosula]|uniref:Uncharacterized protein n=1 Tax=Rubroshorea leprosula TaxID=152421 RepID=A0AAV5MKN1_9ROSI|nr:hypothetical protein SLEP1_g56788 [Rubroshorea leprosula]
MGVELCRGFVGIHVRAQRLGLGFARCFCGSCGHECSWSNSSLGIAVALCTQWACEWCVCRACWQAPCSCNELSTLAAPQSLQRRSLLGSLRILCCLPASKALGCHVDPFLSVTPRGSQGGREFGPVPRASLAARRDGARVPDCALGCETRRGSGLSPLRVPSKHLL